MASEGMTAENQSRWDRYVVQCVCLGLGLTWLVACVYVCTRGGMSLDAFCSDRRLPECICSASPI